MVVSFEKDPRKLRKEDFNPIFGFFNYAKRNLKNYVGPGYKQIVTVTALSYYNMAVIIATSKGLQKLIEVARDSELI